MVEKAPKSLRRLEWSFLGRVGYRLGEDLQRRCRERLSLGEGAEVLLLLEHPHVFTLGRNARSSDVLAPPDWLRRRGVLVTETDRGGQVTYHGPGQLVGYPIIDLNPDRRDIRRYMWDLQSVLVRVLEEVGVEAEARRGAEDLGVWAAGRKIASLGVHISRWITSHGFALNVTTDLGYFEHIVPCGMSGVRMTSVESLTGRRPTLARVAEACARHFCEVFRRQPVRRRPEELMSTR